MQFNPGWNNQDTNNYGPHCRNCHKGSSDCGACHDSTGTGIAADWPKKALAADTTDIVDNLQGKGLKSDGTLGLFPAQTSYATGGPNWTAPTAGFDPAGAGIDYWKHERTVYMSADWRTNAGYYDQATKTAYGINVACSNDGFSWPHRTLGFKLLKDELWGLDFDGTQVAVGETRDGAYSYITTASVGGVVIPTGTATSTVGIPSNLLVGAHDLDSVCLDCHKTDIWNPTNAQDYTDDPSNTLDDKDDELLLRGLP